MIGYVKLAQPLIPSDTVRRLRYAGLGCANLDYTAASYQLVPITT
jgi:hypothetical protein